MPNPQILSIGHSTQEVEDLAGTLRRFGVKVLVDVRSVPHSATTPQFNEDRIAEFLRGLRIRYVHVPELGGRPKGSEFYDSAGHVLYAKVAQTEWFQRAAQFLLESEVTPIAIMCAEEDPTACHRRLLVGRYLESKGVSVMHLRRDGTAVSEEDLSRKEHQLPRGQNQLMDKEVRVARKSIPSVLRKSRPNLSSSRLDAPEYDDSSTSE